MKSYYCIVNMPGVPAREIQVLDAGTDAGAIEALSPIADRWAGYDTICLYQGERVVKVLSNPALGFPQNELAICEALDLWAEAA